MADERIDHGPWPLRTFILLAAGIAFGLAVYLLARGESGRWWSWTASVPRLSLAIFVAAAGLLFAYTFERVRWRWSLGFALAGGAVLGAIYYWNGSLGHRGFDDALRFYASFFAIAIAAPLFQTMRDEGAARLPYKAVHAHSWTNVVLWFAALAFLLVAWLLIWLLSDLFRLIGLNFLSELINEDWFAWVWFGGALGAAIGLLRDTDRVLSLLQRVVTTVLSVFAPVLAIGLVLFVLALPFTGLDNLWERTRSATPILLAAAAGAIILVNAVIGNAPEEEAKGPLLRYSAMALGAVLVPLVAVAAISTALRIDQYGFTPSRLWGAVAVAIAAAYALCYLYALVRGRLRWADRVRPANIRLAIGVCILALLLATPLARFGAISARSQLSRLESGRVSPADFDWAAMRFDFGAAGVRTLERLKDAGTTAQIRRGADSALRTENRWDLAFDESPPPAPRPGRIEIRPPGAVIPPALLGRIRAACNEGGDCLVFYQPEQRAATLLEDNCGLLLSGAYVRPDAQPGCRFQPSVFVERDGNWVNYLNRGIARLPPDLTPEADRASKVREAEAILRGEVEVRTVEQRQLFIAGQPITAPFD